MLVSVTAVLGMIGLNGLNASKDFKQDKKIVRAKVLIIIVENIVNETLVLL
jgi:hypothetical protein